MPTVTRYDDGRENFQQAINKCTQVTIALGEALSKVKDMRDDFAYLEEIGASEKVNALKFRLARHALELDAARAQFEDLIKQLKTTAGDKALKNAAAPPVFTDPYVQPQFPAPQPAK